MKLIPLTQGKFAQVDDEDYEWLMQWKWRYCQGYATRSLPRNGRKQGSISMHRQIMQTPEDMETDHINANGETDGLNNQRYNLRVCTPIQNRQNKRISSRNKCGLKGVFWVGKRKKWKASICGKEVGYFSDPLDAARAYDKAAREMFGEFARLNFPDG